MSISVKLTSDIKEIEDNVNLAMVNYINDVLKNKQSYLLAESKKLVSGWVKSQPEIVSLSSYEAGSLVALFGITGSTSAIIDSIINSVVGATEVRFIPFKKNFNGGLDINFQPSNFANLLGLSSGRTTILGGDLHWLEWLLKKGDSIIVANYTYNPVTGLGRSKLGNMISGGSFRVPPQFSGTESNNFITRALIGQEQEKQLTQLFQQILK